MSHNPFNEQDHPRDGGKFTSKATPAGQRASAPAPPDQRAAFAAEHANDTVVVWAVRGPVVAPFGDDDNEIDRDAWSQAFDTTLDEYIYTGECHISDMFDRCRELALANGASDNNDDRTNGSERRRMFQHYLGFYATIDDHYGTVDMDTQPHHDLPVMRDTPEGMIRVEATIGGDPGYMSKRTVWLVDPDEYATRSEFGFVIDPDRHQQILNMEADR